MSPRIGIFFGLLYCLAGCFPAAAQPAAKVNAKQLIAAVDSFNTRQPAEALFLHFDKPYYAVGDTIWFKAYLFRAATHDYSPFSGLLYVDLINDSSKKVRRMSVPVNFGVSWGQLPLTEEEMRDGSYTVCAYTRWMRNFGEECFFRRHFVIAPAAEKEWQPRRQGSGRTRKSDLQSGKSDLQSGKTDLQSGKSDLQSGKMDLHSGKSDLRKTDVQFMPESGWLVAGIPSRVGFKAIGDDGLGVDIQGTIVDSRDREVVPFQSLYKGMGVCSMTPVAGETYSALVRLPDGRMDRYPLPAVKKKGIVLRVNNQTREDSLHVTILSSPDMINGQVYHLLGLSRGAPVYGANFVLNRPAIEGVLAKSIFPSGITHFTLFNHSGEPVSERILFINHRDELRIGVTSDKDSYAARDSISLHIQVTDHEGQPVAGSFSLAVTDDAQIRTDSLLADDILTHMLLTADLKGLVETPGWYFRQEGPVSSAQRDAAMDALMLTQGWIGYKWQDLLKEPRTPLFTAEDKRKVTGKVTNLLNRPVHDARVTLMTTGKLRLVMDTVTDAEGRFCFTDFPPVDTIAFVLQARNAKGNSGGMGITIDAYEPPPADRLSNGIPAPGYAADDSILRRYVRNNAAILKEKSPYAAGRGTVLQAVTVRTTKAIKGSSNLNGPGQADQVIDEASISAAGKLSLKQLLQEKVKGFNTVYARNGVERYMIFRNPAHIIIDGVNLSRFAPEKETLEFLTAEDVTGIEVMVTARHSNNYKSAFLSPTQQANLMVEYAFLEITTRSGNGVFMKKTPGVSTYKPLPMSWPATFYRPRYNAVSSSALPPDLRSTIHWQPSLVTNQQGQAMTSFYAAGSASTYTLIIQGSDMNGNIGVAVKKIVISN
ncbi:hypothetical protein Q4E93_31815 [Flavitalea sp. BT771]|uniref:hypothetical protein n=1 Tax=Flavitalea sp. BT771 TaxID=3063329 RepID=UPI0026E26407|nr:hypothetical protein [Flavitalea sp. BT771]MDO6435247.1 hypothetical protein [Flavitalea sp. BT771]MDV6224048.1 hypothetical protein [Flavitalea sp. BT771]